MLALASVLLVVLVTVAFVACGNFLKYKNGKEVEAVTCFFIGFIFVWVLAFSPFWNPSGLPHGENIDPGIYKVGFVYVAGENVNVAIEVNNGAKDLKDLQESIYYYQFKKEAFEGTLNPNAKTLIVVQTGSFKKLRLE